MAKKQLNTRIPEELFNKVLEKELSSNLKRTQIVIDALMLYFDNNDNKTHTNDNTERLQSHIESLQHTITNELDQLHQDKIRILEENHTNVLNEKEERIRILQETYNDLKDQLETKDRQIHNMQLLELQLPNTNKSRPLLESGKHGRFDGLKLFLFGK